MSVIPPTRHSYPKKLLLVLWNTSDCATDLMTPRKIFKQWAQTYQCTSFRKFHLPNRDGYVSDVNLKVGVVGAQMTT